MTTIRHIGVLTGGGDCPGMNAALRALVKAATHRHGLRVSVGFDSARAIATDAVDRLHSTAASHHRIMVVEVMGRHAGWIALAAGVAST